MPWIRGSLWSIEGSVAARGTYRNTVGHSATAARRVTSILTACSPTISMAGSGGAATRRTYRDTVGYSAIVAGRMGAYYPYRLYAYCYAPGVGLPPYREWPARPGRTVRGTVRSNPKRSYLDSFRLFWKSRGKSTRACGKNTRWLRLDLIEVSPGHFDSGLRGLVESPPVVAQHAPCGRLLLPPATVFVFGC